MQIGANRSLPLVFKGGIMAIATESKCLTCSESCFKNITLNFCPNYKPFNQVQVPEFINNPRKRAYDYIPLMEERIIYILHKAQIPHVTICRVMKRHARTVNKIINKCDELSPQEID